MTIDAQTRKLLEELGTVSRDIALSVLAGEEERQDDRLCADQGRAPGFQEGDGAGASEDGKPRRQGNHPGRLSRHRLQAGQPVIRIQA